VAQDDRAQAHAPVDELVAVHVPAVRSVAALDEVRRPLGILIGPLAVGVRPGGNERLRPVEEIVGALEVADPGPLRVAAQNVCSDEK